MKRNDSPVPLTSAVLVFPRWLRAAGYGAGAGSVALALLLLTVGVGPFARLPERARTIGIALLVGSGLAMLVVMGFVRWVGRRVRAPGLFLFLTDEPRTRRIARAATFLFPAFLLFGVIAVGVGNVRVGVVGGFVNCCVVALAAAVETVSRHFLRQQASAVFTLYAEGVLAPGDAAAIDDAREKDPQFDAAVREHQRVVAMVEQRVQPGVP
jgi:hypothetical protein